MSLLKFVRVKLQPQIAARQAVRKTSTNIYYYYYYYYYYSYIKQNAIKTSQTHKTYSNKKPTNINIVTQKLARQHRGPLGARLVNPSIN